MMQALVYILMQSVDDACIFPLQFFTWISRFSLSLSLSLYLSLSLFLSLSLPPFPSPSLLPRGILRQADPTSDEYILITSRPYLSSFPPDDTKLYSFSILQCQRHFALPHNIFSMPKKSSKYRNKIWTKLNETLFSANSHTIPCKYKIIERMMIERA